MVNVDASHLHSLRLISSKPEMKQKGSSATVSCVILVRVSVSLEEEYNSMGRRMRVFASVLLGEV